MTLNAEVISTLASQVPRPALLLLTLLTIIIIIKCNGLVDVVVKEREFLERNEGIHAW